MGFVSMIVILKLALLKTNVMKKYLTSAIILVMLATGATLKAQARQDEYLGLPGDNLNLYAVMKLFQESPTLETFERDLNDQSFRINNLDLNGDNMIDYLTVRDYADRDVHTIVLQDAINNRETQDVAVFTVQRFQNGQVQIQLIGDEALYGKNYIIEPITDEELASQTPNPGYTGNPAYNGTVVRTTYYEIAAWPMVRFIYSPGYVGWHSSWYWGYYPTYWHPWRPYYWDYYYGYHYHMYNDYYRNYRHWNNPRYTHWNDSYYTSRRSYSPYVSGRIKSGTYKVTYSHPEQRSKGEALYTSTAHNQTNRRSEPSHVNNQVRSNDTRASQHGQPAGNNAGTSRRSTAPETRSSGNTSKPETRSNGNTRKPESVTPAARPSGNAGTGSVNHTSAGNNSSPARRAAATTTAKPAANPKPAQASQPARSAPKPARVTTTSSPRRSSSESKPATSAKSSDNKKSGETAKPDRRK